MASTPVGAWVLVGGKWRRGGRDIITPPPPPPPPPATGARFSCDPGKNSRTLFYGQSKQNNGAVDYQETAAAVRLGCHRTYFSSLAQIAPGGPLTQMVKADHAADRLPVVSLRFPSVAAAAAGTYDAQIDALIADLEVLSKPMAVAVHHEPENDGLNPADWRALQVRIRARLNAYRAAHPGQPHRIAFYSCLMAFTWLTSSGRNPDDWWAGPGVHDFVAADHYTQPNQAIVRQQLTSFIAWCNARSVPYAVAEWGLLHTDTTAATKMQGFYNTMTDGAHDCIALLWFDSTVGGTGDWTLTDVNGELSKHRQLMADPRSIHLSDLGF